MEFKLLQDLIKEEDHQKLVQTYEENNHLIFAAKKNENLDLMYLFHC
jgi:hypothetical protein